MNISGYNNRGDFLESSSFMTSRFNTLKVIHIQRIYWKLVEHEAKSRFRVKPGMTLPGTFYDTIKKG
jgi:hypothetical protein